MATKKFGEIFLTSILPALITGGLGYFAGSQVNKKTTNMDSASVQIEGTQGGDVSGVKAINSTNTTVVEKGDYNESDLDTSRYLVKRLGDTIYLIPKK